MQHVGDHVGQSWLVARHIANAVRAQQHRFRTRVEHRGQSRGGNAGSHVDHGHIVTGVGQR